MSPTTVPNFNQWYSGLTLSQQPQSSGYVGVMVNGWLAWVANGNSEILAADCYFSDDYGITAKAYGAFSLNDRLYWNSILAGFPLINGIHYVDFLYRA